MSLATVATILSVIGGGGFVGLLSAIIKISMDYQKLKTTVEQNEARDKEFRMDTDKNFNELYASRNKTNEVLTELSTTVKMLVANINQQFVNLDKKIDELKAAK